MEFKVFTRDFCPVCEAQTTEMLFSTYDDRYGQPDLFNILECQQCGSCYLYEAILPEQISKLYEKYYGYTASGPSSTKSLISFLSRVLAYARRTKLGQWYDNWYGFWTKQRPLIWSVQPNERVLDVGCGYGHLARFVSDRGAHWVGIEPDFNACQAVRQRGLECLYGTIETVDIPDNSFDVIIGSQVIEHSIDPYGFMKRCNKALRQGGRLLLATPNIQSRFRQQYEQNWIHWFVPYHQVLFSPQSIQYLGKRSGFHVNACWTETPTSWHLLQRNYCKPTRGEKGDWVHCRTPTTLQPEWLSLKLRIDDVLKNNSDVLLAELIKL